MVLLLLDALHRIGVGCMSALEDDGEERSEEGDEDSEGINPPREADAVTELRKPVVADVVDDWDGDDGGDAHV